MKPFLAVLAAVLVALGACRVVAEESPAPSLFHPCCTGPLWGRTPSGPKPVPPPPA